MAERQPRKALGRAKFRGTLAVAAVVALAFASSAQAKERMCSPYSDAITEAAAVFQSGFNCGPGVVRLENAVAGWFPKSKLTMTPSGSVLINGRKTRRAGHWDVWFLTTGSSCDFRARWATRSVTVNELQSNC
jgi:hypothetical protein